MNKKYHEYRTSSLKLRQAYDKKFEYLIQNGIVVESSYRELIWINPTNLVPKLNGDFRLVIDIWKVNCFMEPIHFKMEGVHTLKDLIQPKDYAITYDLKDAYNHVPVHPSMSPLLGVAWRGKCYRFVGMPFGLSDAPRVFSSIMKKVVTTIREVWNVKAVIYLDDLILLHQNPDILQNIGKEVLLFLQWLGWTVNQQKSCLIPNRIWTYLGWEWNSITMSVHLKKERREKAMNLLRRVRRQVYHLKMMKTRTLAKVIGVLSSTRLQFPKASLYLSKLNQLKTKVVKHVGWNGEFRLNYSILRELVTWKE
jgi:hypothetical protein